MAVRYPREFEIYRLEALGDPPYLDAEEARTNYLGGHVINVIPAAASAAGKPAWHLLVGPDGFRFSLSFYGELGTPLRDVKWERVGDNLVLRSTKDLFYPEGDPGRKVPYSQVVSVTREFSTDGIATTVLASPGQAGARTQVTGVSLHDLTLPIPEFGEWDELVDGSAPAGIVRFGAGAAEGAKQYAATSPGTGAVEIVRPDAVGASGGWQVNLTGRDIIEEVARLLATGATRLVVLERGAVRILPLAVQADLASDRDSEEEVRRMSSLANDIDMELEHREGRGIDLEFDANHWSDTVDAYVESLHAVGADDARFWGFENNQTAVVLVWSGDMAIGTRQLALHIVPSSWVSDRYPGEPSRVDLRWDADSVQAIKEKDA